MFIFPIDMDFHQLFQAISVIWSSTCPNDDKAPGIQIRAQILFSNGLHFWAHFVGGRGPKADHGHPSLNDMSSTFTDLFDDICIISQIFFLIYSLLQIGALKFEPNISCPTYEIYDISSTSIFKMYLKLVKSLILKISYLE